MKREMKQEANGCHPWLCSVSVVLIALSSCGNPIESEVSQEREPTVLEAFTGSASEALRKGLVQIEGVGLGTFRNLNVELKNDSERPLNLELDAGTYFNNPDDNKQNLILLEDVSLNLAPGESRSEQVASACCNAGLGVPGRIGDWPVAEAPKDLDVALKFLGEYDAEISAYLRQKNPERLGTKEQQNQFKQVLVWAYLGGEYDDMRRMLAQEVFHNETAQAEAFLALTLEDARELAEMLRNRDRAEMVQWIQARTRELLNSAGDRARDLGNRGRERLRGLFD